MQDFRIVQGDGLLCIQCQEKAFLYKQTYVYLLPFKKTCMIQICVLSSP